MVIAAIAAITVFCGCNRLDDNRIPPAPVYIAFPSEAEWRLYGVTATPDHRSFIKPERKPANFPYTALSQTGFGGVLLVADVHNTPQAFDLACPVEARQDVRIAVDEEKHDAYCPKCHSRYSIYTNGGTPTSGPALDDGYGLTRYACTPRTTGEYMVISR